MVPRALSQPSHFSPLPSKVLSFMRWPSGQRGAAGSSGPKGSELDGVVSGLDLPAAAGGKSRGAHSFSWSHRSQQPSHKMTRQCLQAKRDQREFSPLGRPSREARMQQSSQRPPECLRSGPPPSHPVALPDFESQAIGILHGFFARSTASRFG